MSGTNLEVAVLAGGCFWCTEAIFKRLKGVKSVTSGYAGGEVDSPSYETVSSGETGYAEAIELEFKPAEISYEHLLDIFWATHDPTTLNRQGADTGSQYRSAIFYVNDQQKKLAEASKFAMGNSREFSSNLVTIIEPLKKFYSAEQYHQNYYDSNKNSNAYCSLVIDPKIKKLLDKFNADIKDEFK